VATRATVAASPRRAKDPSADFRSRVEARRQAAGAAGGAPAGRARGESVSSVSSSSGSSTRSRASSNASLDRELSDTDDDDDDVAAGTDDEEAARRDRSRRGKAKAQEPFGEAEADGVRAAARRVTVKEVTAALKPADAPLPRRGENAPAEDAKGEGGRNKDRGVTAYEEYQRAGGSEGIKVQRISLDDADYSSVSETRRLLDKKNFRSLPGAASTSPPPPTSGGCCSVQ
jgi:hypothetical protein